MNDGTRERAVQLFAALSHTTRLRIVELLEREPKGCSVNDIAESLGLSQSSTSQHLAILTRAGVLAVEPQGVSRIYRRRGPRIGHVLSVIEEFCSIHNLYGTPEGGLEQDEGGEALAEGGPMVDPGA